ncbi:DUF1800 domain-containing protein [Hydrogenophaga sp.]|uniref:DUF1800 domain-containing protein n=1 Tax=Hydrogenophaga sp. TaxID=1904254 RepID=UPI0019B87C4F|nr:DUF1800 domain-containing protein [Hydrogenophaga sp.]MBD3892807.1 DUF1800 domain-containing protein [Hydrogenophaga sp.]
MREKTIGPALVGAWADLRCGLRVVACCAVFTLAACGGGGGAAAPGAPTDSGTGGNLPDVPTSQRDAVRLADQASFGPTEELVASIRRQGAAKWISQQMAAAPVSRYSSGGSAAVHQHGNANPDFCAHQGPTCWRDYYSSTPLLWDFYRNAVQNPDQLRQRVAFALQQIVVVSNLEVTGTYGLRNYHNMLLEQSFGNYRDLLRQVALSPVMGEYLNNVNNHRSAPNENFVRELLQLFALGTCELNPDGTLRGGACQATYNNDVLRNYVFALTGWTYPPGGNAAGGCWPRGSNCRFYQGDMVPLAAFHDNQPRTLLSGVTLPANRSAPQALEAVLDSLMAHPNIGPFVGRQLIQHLVSSNPSPAYVQRVARAFNTGRHEGFGSGRPGDMKATVAAILLDPQARNPDPDRSAGRLREPVQLFTGVLRALGGRTDGDALGWWWGQELRQHVFRPPSVFNFYPPDYPVPGTTLQGPAFGIHNANTALQRINYLTYLLFWGGSNPDIRVPNALGTRVDLSAFLADAADPARLVDRLALLALGEPLPAAARTAVLQALDAFPSGDADYRANRVRQAAFLVFAAPQYHLIR